MDITTCQGPCILEITAQPLLDNTTTETLSGVSTTSGGIVSLLFTVPSGTTSITMKLEMSGDFDSSSEYVNIYANNNLIGSSVTTGYSDSTLRYS